MSYRVLRPVPLASITAVLSLGIGITLASGGAASAAATGKSWAVGSAVSTTRPTTSASAKPRTKLALAATTSTTTSTYTYTDDFTGTAGTKPANWNYQTGGTGWGNNELEYYTNRASNGSLDGSGHLAITVRRETYTGSDGVTRGWTSARLFSKAAVSVGYAEARILMPAGDGLWPAFWTLGGNITSAGWPVCGEIDAVETSNAATTAYGHVHGPDYAKSSAYAYGSSKTATGGLAGTWHTFAISKTSTSITWYLDGVAYYTFTKSMLKSGQSWVFDQPQYLLLNVAVGGNGAGSPTAATPAVSTMLVDWVRVGAGVPPDAR